MGLTSCDRRCEDETVEGHDVRAIPKCKAFWLLRPQTLRGSRFMAQTAIRWGAWLLKHERASREVRCFKPLENPGLET